MPTLNQVEMTAAWQAGLTASKGDMKVKVIIWPDGQTDGQFRIYC